MCGIVGFITTNPAFNKHRADYLEQALYADALRGRHSTGVYTVEKNYDGFYMKDKVDAQRFLDDRNCYNFVRGTDVNVRAAVGHNRFATQGGKELNSAHPFITEHVTLVHNGTLRGAWRVTFPEHPLTSVDSARLAQALNDTEPGGKDVLEKIDGAYALVWYDHRSKTMYMARNTERPLTYTIVGDTMYFASEGGMLEWLLGPERIGVLKEPKASSLEPHTLYKWALGDTKLKLQKPKVLKYTPYTPPVYTPPAAYYGWRKSGNHLPAVGNGSTTAGETNQGSEGKDGKHNDIDAINEELAKLGIDAKYGDIVEVQAGEVKPYRHDSVVGSTLGWFEDEDLEGIVDEFDNNVYANVHQVPILGDQLIQTGIWHDSYYARIVGLSQHREKWMNKDDVLLNVVFEEVAARTDLKTDWKGKLKDVFKNMRMSYQSNDRPIHKCGEFTLTNRELDLLTLDYTCRGCNAPASLLIRSQVHLSDDGTGFKCDDCESAQHSKQAT